MVKQRAQKARLPVHHLKKAEFVWLGSHKCQHGHNYLEQLLAREADSSRWQTI